MRRQVLPLELERRSDQRVLYGPRFEREGHGPGLGMLRERARELANALQCRRPCAGRLQTRQRIRIELKRAGQALPASAAQHHDAGDEWPVVAKSVGLLKQRIGRDGELQVSRRDLLAGGGDDDFLQAAQDANAPILDRGLVTGVQPAINEGCGGVLLTLPVAAHHAAAAHLQFLMLADAHLHPRQRAADGGRVVVIQRIARNDGRCLGHAVALQNRQPQPEKAVGNGRRQRRPAAHGQPQPAAELRRQRPRHQALEQRPHQLVQQPRCADVQRQPSRAAKAPPADGLGTLEQP